ncbi:MAG TPA: CRTAC1 family protein, partial [Planctomycetaceae bacterium]|nr:CRTAC1 family protein [Planctomycetaceae bacterium]
PRGVALNMSGQATAAMGIATGDVTGDGIPDLFVTNYKGEANCLYIQTEDGLFTDAISGTGLLQPTLEYIKWGTQFLDADNDGDLDLIIANGHVGDFHLPNIECYMPTQLLQNRGGGTFVEERAVAVGEYFERKLLGRSVALVDWNRDGRMDVVASSIAAPAAVLTNISPAAGSYLTLRLHAVKSARDAFGAQVIVTTDVGAFHQQLIAGGGYQASNERALHFGLGQAARIEHVDVEWPSGERDSYKAPEINSATNLIEGRSTSPTGN